MHLSRKSPIIQQFFSWYTGYLIRRDFGGYSYDELSVADDEAILLLANHFSWWDGLLLFQLNRLVFKKDFHILVGQTDFEKRWFLKYLGAFSPSSTGKDTVATLRYAGQLLDNPANLVLLFPQGKLYSAHVTAVNFEKGVMQVVNASQKKFKIIFAATFADYFASRKPRIKTALQCWEAEEYVSLQLLKSEYNKHYTKTLKEQTKIIV